MTNDSSPLIISRLLTTELLVKPTKRPTLPPVITGPPINSCGLTSEEREVQIIGELSAVSSPALFEETDSPQSQALDWIVNKDSAFLCPGAPGLVQRYTLGVFYYSTEGDSWKECNAPGDFSSETSISAANSACTLTTTNATQIFPVSRLGPDLPFDTG